MRRLFVLGSESPLSRSVAWVLVSTTHYHHARMAAFADAWPHGATIVEITDTDSVRALEARKENAPYARHTLLPGAPTDQVYNRPVGSPLGETLDRIRPGVVCINGWSVGISREALQWCVRNGAGSVVMSETTAGDRDRGWFRERVKRRLLALCSAALVGGAPHASYLESLGFPRDRIFDGYDVVDNDYFRAGSAAARRDPDGSRARLGLPARYFLAVGRFGQKKNLSRLLQAYAQYRSLAGEGAWDLLLLGDGELRPALARLAATLGMERAVHMPGFASYADLPACYALAQCFVHASTTEQWGLVVNEAMASGAPVLVSNRCGCCTDLVREGVNGYSFDPFDVESLAGLMLRCHREAAGLPAMAVAGSAIIREWGPARFARNLTRAAETALAAGPRHASLADRALLAALAHV